MERNELAQRMYHAYGLTTDFKNYQGLPMPAWEALTPKIQSAWEASAFQAISDLRLENPFLHVLDAREEAQVAHALEYAEKHSKAGVPGHGQFLLIAKMAKALGL